MWEVPYVSRIDASVTLAVTLKFPWRSGTALRHILQSLKPDGRFVIADYSLPSIRSEARSDQRKIHEIDPELARDGSWGRRYQVLKNENPFSKRMPEVSGGQSEPPTW